MLADCKLLTLTTTFANCASHALSTTTSIASTYHFGRAESVVSAGEEADIMAHERSRSRPRSRAEDNTELWFNMPSSYIRHLPEPSAYQTTSSRHSIGSTASASSHVKLSIPTISTSPDLNKTLPPPPTETPRKSQMPATLRSFLRSRSSSNHLDPSQLQPEQHAQHHRYTSTGAHLSVDVHSNYQQQQSRSMPSSPYQQAHESTPAYPPPLTRVQSANPAFPDTTQYQPYSAAQHYPRRVSSHFDAVSPTRARTFPETTTMSPTARSSASGRPRPHTWLSPTEPFVDPSQFHLFVEATTGLSDDVDPWSPNGPNRLGSSLFARRPSNGAVPVLPQYVPAPIPEPTYQTASWQSYEPPLITPRSVSAPLSGALHQDVYQTPHTDIPSHVDAVNAELEMLGLEANGLSSDEELPDYAQSQAEMTAKKREEAAARARDLEARWRGARGRRS